MLRSPLRRVPHVSSTSNLNARVFHLSSIHGKVLSKISKSYADLPSTYIRPDGTIAEPLGECWNGTIQPQPIKATRSTPSLIDDPQSDLQHDVGKRKPKCTRASKARASLTQPDEPLILNHTVEPSEKPKRQRKRTLSKQPKMIETGGQPQTNLAQEILDNLRKFPHCFLLTRVGQFYESYFDQANEIARLLNIKLTTRKWGGRRVPMCGFPLIHLDKHLKVLVQQNKRFVAMCEEFPRYSGGVKAFDRRVARVITPGTLIDEAFLNPFENNYLLAISMSLEQDSKALGLAWIDVSTGEFFSKITTVDSLRDELARISPKEVVLDSELKKLKDHAILEALAEDNNVISYCSLLDHSGNHTDTVTATEKSTDLLSQVPTAPPGFDDFQLASNEIPAPEPEEVSSIALLTAYLNANLLEHTSSLLPPNREYSEGRMHIDFHTIKALEIHEAFREGGVKGSLLSTIKRTVTTGGSRLLSRWLCSPSTSISEIKSRQSTVAFFYARPHFQADLRAAMANAEDAGRIVQKFMYGRGDPSDLLAVKRAIHMWSSLVTRFQDEKRLESIERGGSGDEEWSSLDALISRFVSLDHLSQRIGVVLEDRSIEEVTLIDSTDEVTDDATETDTGGGDGEWRYGPSKWIIKPDFSASLTTLHASLKNLLRQREELERRLQNIYNAPSLSLRASPALGMHVHLAKSKRDQHNLNESQDFISIAESGSTRCYFFKDWAHLGSEIASTTLALTQAEKDAFETLRSEVNSHSMTLKRNARVLDELDVALSFAQLATELNFVRPTLTEDKIYDVTNGRHPTVELGLLAAGRTFTPNSVILSPSSSLHVITGPNMAGKSTLLRQTALITILAQTGSFVPADSAIVGIADKLFSRVGAKDDLFHDRSTFMVEMLETAEILQRATPKSLVIMDEVGRGTTVSDGLAIAFATLYYLATKNRCRVLFATHFHELSDMIGYPESVHEAFKNVDFFCTDVDETDDGHFAYRYRLRSGINRDSHGLKVAELAGMPSAAVAIAKETLFWLKSQQPERLVFKFNH